MVWQKYTDVWIQPAAGILRESPDYVVLCKLSDVCNVVLVCDVTSGLGPRLFFFIYPTHLLLFGKLLLFHNKLLRVLAFIPMKS